MKIVIRKHSFETNSSSHHSLIISNEKRAAMDIRKLDGEIEPFVGGASEAIKNKEDKAYFLAGLFDYENHYWGSMEEEYEVFLSVLRDNDEEEILKNIEKNKQEYLAGRRYDPYCNNYFFDGPLCDCTCFFSDKFKKYFEVSIDSADIIKEIGENKKDFIERLEQGRLKKKEELYQKLYDFLYGDGVLIPYEYM